MPLANPIPTTVVTGFLGAGKTTLIRHLMETAGGRRIALIINEFGDVGMDRDILSACGVAGCGEDDIVELANGCLCCTVADEFLPTMEALLDRDPPPDHIVIETSGLALPKPLVRAFTWPEVRSRVTVDGVLAVIDAPAVRAGLFADDPEAVRALRAADAALDHDNPLEEVFTDQLLCADLVIVNKTDLLDDAERATVEDQVRAAARPGVAVVGASHGRIDPAIMLGLGMAAESDLESRPSHHDSASDHDHDDFNSIVAAMPPVPASLAGAGPQAVADALAPVLAAHGALRVKGALDVPGKPMRLVVQGVGPRVQAYYDRPWRAAEGRAGRLVVIGLNGFDADAVTAGLAASLRSGGG
ncbi:cobalamin biosynthesis protein CobW [Roseospira visakhapatnamensis]|uniref:Cobalamin biosynthesis protein CobW n=1 Tax=Roseospira visakhapatnamensis TaxID=390880 RepID=A0A7W6W892_9PROT|nr:cobalamin biosynthesis protein CobW [Roseospira visakhapatnamensis]MBB4264558.1 cobalamin biosynthesis protein CobW [Roseospira visakhapatnamensis]